MEFLYLAKESPMKAKQVSLILLIALVLSLISVRQAQAKDLVKVTIVGPGLDGTVELTDEEGLNVFGKLELANQIDKPASAETEPYFEISVALGTGSEIEATYIYDYYPASNKHPSYVYYPDVANVMSDVEGYYFLLSEGADRALRDHLTILGASLSGRTSQPTTRLTFPSPLPWFIIGTCLCITIGIAISLKRRNTAPTSR
jgi:hypothetical protein